MIRSEASDGAGVEAPIVLFDGVCNLCNGWVDFVIRHDGGAGFRFAPLQSGVAGRLLEDSMLAADPGDSVVLMDESGTWTESTAALRVLRRLRFPYRLFYGFVVIPRPLRDWGYRVVARNRYRWFGRRDTCRVPTPEEGERFL